MLIIVEDAAGKRAAQRRMEQAVKSRLPSQGVRNIGFRSNNRDETIYSSGTGSLWCAFGSAEEEKTPRRWNAFGVFDADRRAQVITVEANIPTTSNSARVSGFFARDPESGAVYLMHDGGVGGGKAGVGQVQFLAWSGIELQSAERTTGRARQGILIGRVDSPHLASRIWSYVQRVRAFKDAVDAGLLDTDAMRRRIAEWEEYRRESSGRRKGSRRAEIDYVSYHGDIVELLKLERDAVRAENEKVLNSPLIDLYVRKGSTMTEIYEVKTSLGRQSFYTGVGQLIAHSAGHKDVLRTLIVPEGRLPDDIERSLRVVGIAVRRFRLRKGAIPKLQLL